MKHRLNPSNKIFSGLLEHEYRPIHLWMTTSAASMHIRLIYSRLLIPQQICPVLIKASMDSGDGKCWEKNDEN